MNKYTERERKTTKLPLAIRYVLMVGFSGLELM